MNFNFHDVVGYQLRSEDAEAQEFFKGEYRHHLQEQPLQGPPVTLTWRRGLPSLAGSGYRFHVHKLLACWSYRVEFDHGGVQIDAVGNRYAIPMVHHMMVHPALRYLASQRDTLMLHGAAVVKDGCSMILTGRGGAGKTTTSSMLLAQGGADWQLHADDYVFLGPGPHSHAYMTRSHLYKDLLRWLPDMKLKLSPYERLRLFLYGNLREWTRDGIKWPVRVSSERLWPDHTLAHSARLGSVLLLRRAAVPKPQLVPVDSLDEVVESLVEMNFYEARHFIHLMNGNPGGPPDDDWLEAWQSRERDLMKHCLSQTSVQWLELPQTEHIDRQLGFELVDLLGPLQETLHGS